MLSSSLPRGIASNSNTGKEPSNFDEKLNPIFEKQYFKTVVSVLHDSAHTLPVQLESYKEKTLGIRRKLSICELYISDTDNKSSKSTEVTKRRKTEPVSITFDKVTKKGEGNYYFKNNYMVPGADGYCDGITNLFIGSFLSAIRDPKNKRQIKLDFLETLRIKITPFDILKKLVDNKPYSLHSDKLANKYTTMRLDFMSKAISGQLAPDYVPQHFDRIGQIACYPKDMLKSLFDIINFMQSNKLEHMALKILIDQHAMGVFIVRDHNKNIYVVYTMDPNEGARYKRTEITDSQIVADFKNSTIFNFLTQRALQDRLVGIDCLIEKGLCLDNLHSQGLINQVLLTSILHNCPEAERSQIYIISDLLYQAVDTDNMQLLKYGIRLIHTNKDIYENVPYYAVQENGANFAASLVNYALQLKYEDIAETLIREFQVPALSLGITRPKGDILRFINAERRELDTPLQIAIFTKNYKVVKLLLDTDEEINKAGFKLNDTHKIVPKYYLKEMIERYLREQPELVKSAIIKLYLN